MSRKVYLSKSNKADYDLVASTRSKLQKNGFEVSEYKGGRYDQNVLFYGCEAIICVSHPDAYNEADDSLVELGKGILSEMEAAFEKEMKLLAVDKEGNLHKVTDVSHYPKSQTDRDDGAYQFRMGYLTLIDRIDYDLNENTQSENTELPPDLDKRVL
jgi:hypothetical protein